MFSISKLRKGPVRHRRTIVAAALGIVVWSIALFWWETSRAVRQARARADAELTIPVTVRPLDDPLPRGVEPVGAPLIFRDAALFNGHLFVAGPHGLLEYDANGAPVRRFRAGLELPAADIVNLAVGVLAADAKPELLIATTTGGLLVHDGRRVRQVRPERPEYRKLTALLPLGAGRVLLGTEKSGLLVYDGRRVTSAHSALTGVPVTALAGTEGDVWVGTLDRGVLHWRAGDVDRFDESAGLPDARVLSVTTSGDEAYVGTALGVAEFRSGRFVRALGAGLFASAVAVRNNTLVVGTLDETIAEIPLGARPSRGVRPMVQDAPGAIQRFVEAEGSLYALAPDAVYAVDGPTARLRRVVAGGATALSDRNVSALAADRSGRLWVGYFDRGLDIVGADGSRLSHVETDRVFCVNRIVHDPQGGSTAVATANGLVLFDAAGRQKQVLGRAEGLIADHVTDVVLNAGGMTVATPAGLTFIDREGSRSMYAFHGLVNNHVYALGTSGTELLAGTLGGVSILDRGVIHANYTVSNSALTHNWITAAARLGDEWLVGTYGGGVFRLDTKGNWRPLADLNGAIEINPNALAVTETRVFAGTLSSGLLVFDRRSERWTRFEAGLPSMNVTAIAPAGDTVYVGTDNGIVRLREEAFVRR